jgi:hypothetical protein
MLPLAQVIKKIIQIIRNNCIIDNCMLIWGNIYNWTLGQFAQDKFHNLFFCFFSFLLFLFLHNLFFPESIFDSQLNSQYFPQWYRTIN